MSVRLPPLRKGALDVLRALTLTFLLSVLLVISAGGCSGYQDDVSRNHGNEPTQAKKSPENIKIVIDREGIFAVEQQKLSQQFSDGVFLHPEGWKLVHQGKPVNFWINGDDDHQTLYFYGWPNPGKYTRENTYWLMPVENPATPLGSIEPVSTASSQGELGSPNLSGAYLRSVHLEENRSYQPQADGEDHWFWMPLVAPNSTDFAIALDAIAAGPARIRLSVWASSDAEQNPDHHLLIKVNRNHVADELWDGKGVHVIESEFTTDILKDGENQITVEAPGDTEAVVDLIQINGIDLDYTRLPVAIEGQLDFVSSDTPLAFDGFKQSVKLYDITDPYQVLSLDNDRILTDPFTGEPGRRYLVVDPRGILSPVRIEAGETAPDLRSPAAGADYLVIGPEDLLEAMQPLIDFRQSQGYQTAVIPVTAIYDQFGYGAPEPEAINAFLKYAQQSWEPAPRYLVLVGDASYDPRNFLGMSEANRMPAYLIHTEFGGETSSDIGFGQLNDDPWPDIATGIIPARTPGQVSGYVEKVLKYEKNLPDSTEPMALLAVADGQEASFKADAQGFLDLFSGDKYKADLFAPPAGSSDAEQQIIDLFKQGYTLVAYFGHGSIDMWGKDQLFTSQGATQLSGLKRYPVLLNFTCLTGLYTHPKVDSLAETFLWQPDGGAIAVLAPSSLTLPYDQGYLSRSLAQLIKDNPTMTIGELHLQARRQTPVENTGGLDVMRTFMLFGDPALSSQPH
jgi:hypothetical protein